jgi:hypothetical protein
VRSGIVAIEEEFRPDGGCAEEGRFWKSGKESQEGHGERRAAGPG